MVLTHLEKYEFVNGKDDIPQIMENNPAMFETTNQLKMSHLYIRFMYYGEIHWPKLLEGTQKTWDRIHPAMAGCLPSPRPGTWEKT